MGLHVGVKPRILVLAAFLASILLAGCGESGGGVITPEKSENPMKGATEKKAG
ncbi:hypothetical protein BH11ARM2_BH11ARM2_22890 [soil metagenome]